MLVKNGQFDHLGKSVVGLTKPFYSLNFRKNFFVLFLCLPSGMTLQAGKHRNNVRYFHHIELAMDSSGNVSI